MNHLLKYRFVILAVLSSVVFAVYYKGVFNTDSLSAPTSFQQSFLKKEKELKRFLELKKEELQHNSDFGTWKNFKAKAEPNLHIYRNDSLIFWNTNQLPVLQFTDIHFPVDGVIHLQNGWYYAKLFKQENYTVVGSFLLKREFPYENKDLQNSFPQDLFVEYDASISLERIEPFTISSTANTFLFSLVPKEEQPASEFESILLTILLLLSIALWLVVLYRQMHRTSIRIAWLYPVSAIVLLFLSVQFSWFDFMQETAAYQPSLYASNEYFPNFLSYLINCSVLAFVALSLAELLNRISIHRLSKIIAFLSIPVGLILWHFILVLTGELIENSSIPLIIDRLFSLNAFSVMAIISIGLLHFSFFRLIAAGIRLYKRAQLQLSTLAVLIFLGSTVFFIVEISTGNQLFLSSIFPLLLFSLLAFHVYKEGKHLIAMGILFLVLFSSVTSINLSELSQQKEKSDRELFANQLSTEKEVVTEIEYDALSSKLAGDPFLTKFLTSPRKQGVSDFEDAMERRFFNGYWERYEMSFNLFDTSGISLIVDESQNFSFDEINKLILNHGFTSEINQNIHYIHDYTDQYSYVIRQPIFSKDSLLQATLYCTLKSKMIPEEIGFPRLLISSQANVFESLENYSIAKYHSGKLITKYGVFNYPTNDALISGWRPTTGFVDKDGFNHYVLFKSGHDVIVLSSKNYTWIELITAFSYLFCFYGLLLLPFLFGSGDQFSFWKRTFSLAARIQLVLIGLVFVALMGFGWGSGIFVRSQYNNNTSEMIREKMSSVNTELKSKLGTKRNLDIAKDGNYTEYLLRKFAKVFVTDINIYSKKGVLLASSRPKIFNIGLISEQMNPSAFHSMSILSKSEFIHKENIGELNFSSAYLPFYNNEGDLLGYINLQHFGQQEDFENQIQRFLVAIINVFMLLLAISIVLAIFISNWVTAPLRLLQESFAGVKFGKYNQQINYKKDDEIGALVKDYNEKLEELEYAAQQLAQNERESAWREMAKQVAHEIKNPLTPMKLSIQQLQRVYDPNNPNSAEKLEKVTASLIEQIDALTKIANEFSNFAKMPKPNEIEMDLLPVIERVLEVFRTEADCELLLETTLPSMIVLADKDQMLRVFNNLIKNALQSIPEGRIGKVLIQANLEDKFYKITVSDNGSGIASSQLNKIFVPYFTTKSTGTGLGLAMVRQIIENHQGTIDFKTEEEIGTTFIIHLPTLKN